MNILLLVGGLLLILLGANGLTDGAASVAKRFHIPNIVIGLTIVAFGTSAPELTVSVSSALKGSADIAIGNVVGSNIFNTLMIVGCTALFAPIAVTRNTLQKEIPLCIILFNAETFTSSFSTRTLPVVSVRFISLPSPSIRIALLSFIPLLSICANGRT